MVAFLVAAGLTAVGGMVLAGGGLIPSSAAETLAGAAMLTSAVNIGGGFTITQVQRLARGRLCCEAAVLYLAL